MKKDYLVYVSFSNCDLPGHPKTRKAAKMEVAKLRKFGVCAFMKKKK